MLAGHCPAGYDKIGGGCYSKNCKPGYGLLSGGKDNEIKQCWEDCPVGYTDRGQDCHVSTHTYGKGCCCTVFGCCHNCKPTYTDNGCTCGRSAHTYAKKHVPRHYTPLIFN
jgi:hypothetical protein